MISIFIGIAAVLAVVMIVMGGIEYMTSELIGNKEAGKDKIRNAIFGLLLALGAWTILNQINPDILKSDLNTLTTQTVTVDLQENVPQTPTMVNGKLSYGGYAVGDNFAADFPKNSLATLQSGISINKSQCVNIGDTNCTSTLGLDPTIVNSTEDDCGCQLTITAGTEFWLHGGTTGNTSHKPGSATVDLSATADLTNYITGSNAFPADGKVYQSGSVCYMAEYAGQTASTTGNHWHAYKC